MADVSARTKKADDEFKATVESQEKAHRDKEAARARWYDESRATLKGDRLKVWNESGPPGAVHGGGTFASSKE